MKGQTGLDRPAQVERHAKRNRLLYACLGGLLPVVFAAGVWTGVSIESNNTDAPAVSQNSTMEFDLVSQAWNITKDNYVDKTATQPKQMAYGAIAGMVSSLGDTGHSTFLTPEEVNLENSEERGQFEGVGIEIQAKSGKVVVVAPIEGSPAQKGGLHSGDIILKVDGQPIKDVLDASTRIRGSIGTSVTLTVESPSGANRDVTLTRARIKEESVSWRELPGTNIVHLKISSFSEGTATQLENALAAIKAVNAGGIILDLRDNPGGILDEAVGVASGFMRSGNVLLVKDSDGTTRPIPVISANVVTDLPAVLLTNEGTASAAEIVAGALHDAGRAKLVGETTFGTGTVLSQFSLPDGSALLLAVEEWLTPSGKTIWHLGLAPDEVVQLGTDVSPLLPGSEQGLTLDQLKASGDKQLLSALDLLQ
jgi:carboxyl-terminal processing protease